MSEPSRCVCSEVAVTLFYPILPIALGFAAGAMLFVITENIFPEAHSNGTTRIATFALTSGFIVMLILDNWLATAGTSFILIIAAEIGDKSQLVCMTLAARHRALPVLLGAVCAFALLNLGAVLFGAAIATWIPEKIVAIIVACLFAGFGLHALWAAEENQDHTLEKSGHGIFFSTFLLIGAAEFGDKTQIAVAALSSAALPAPVWVGSTLALGVTSAIGVWAGRAVFQYIQIRFRYLLHS